MPSRVYSLTVMTAFILVSPALAQKRPFEQQTFDSNGVKISYLDHGKGEVVVLLHGFSASISMMWDLDLRPALTKEFRVVAPALRGHGMSEKPLNAKDYESDLAEDVIRLLNHLKIKKAHIVGYSMGASVAGKILVTHPDRLLSVTFGGGAPIFRPSKEFVDAFEAAADTLDQGLGAPSLLIAFTPDDRPKPSPEQAAALSKLAFSGRDLKEQKILAAIIRGHLKGLAVKEDQLKANTIPVLFVHGSRETILKSIITESQKVLPAATVRVKVVEKGDHASTLPSPEFRKAVLEFLHNPAK